MILTLLCVLGLSRVPEYPDTGRVRGVPGYENVYPGTCQNIVGNPREARHTGCVSKLKELNKVLQYLSHVLCFQSPEMTLYRSVA